MCIRDRVQADPARTDSPDEVHEEQFFGTTALFGVFHAAGEHYATVTRLEFSREKFLAFQTEGEIWSDLEEKNRRMSMEDANIYRRWLMPILLGLFFCIWE